jgi:uncharacterized membrane protein YjfL (UPF0719 family)
MDLIYWDHYYDSILLVNLLIVVGLFTTLRLFAGTLAHIKASHELFKKDNPAFGISVAGFLFGMAIILSSSIYGDADQDIYATATTTALHGVIGLLLLSLTRIIFSKITLAAMSVRNEIVQGNVAVAIADAGNLIATALIIRAVLVWVTSNSVQDLSALLAGYAISQAILTFVTLLSMRVFSKMNKGSGIQKEMREGNVAVALRFAGQKIATAFAITIASKVVVSEVYEMTPVLGAWFLASLGVIIIMKIISMIAERIILFRVNLKQEVIEQRNIAVGALQAVIYISLGLLVSQL